MRTIYCICDRGVAKEQRPDISQLQIEQARSIIDAIITLAELSLVSIYVSPRIKSANRQFHWVTIYGRHACLNLVCLKTFSL